VSDEEIIDAFKRLARTEGIFCEPASAASVAGLIKTAREGADLSGATAVCVLTGTGLKDPAFAISMADVEAERSEAELEAVASLLRLPQKETGA
ncbi:MAG: pyridoxal-phosphate dependent enzyme, partial [Chloroflexota bacterium]|nr:pyridoxal-phosphate dependent enzyme [Chloroflexota bacterium]